MHMIIVQKYVESFPLLSAHLALASLDLEDHWWRLIKYLELCGKKRYSPNKEKFQCVQREVDFAGF